MRPLRFITLLILAPVLGLATTLGAALALAAWMPMQTQSRHQSYAFIADQRPWSAVERCDRGTWLIWWNQIDAHAMSPGPAPRQFLRDSLRAFVGRPPEYASDSPQTAEDWLALYRDEFGELRDRNPTLRRHLDHPPAWGTFARNNAPPGHVGAGSDHGFGWPRPALWYRVTGVMHYTYSAARNHMIPTASATGIDGGYLLTHPSTLELRGSTFRALPYRIHWRGLLTNTALFAILWFLILFIPGTARRALRRRRARCTACGYDLRGLQTDRCPECGAEAKNDNVTERPGGHKNTRNALATRG